MLWFPNMLVADPVLPVLYAIACYLNLNVRPHPLPPANAPPSVKVLHYTGRATVYTIFGLFTFVVAQFPAVCYGLLKRDYFLPVAVHAIVLANVNYNWYWHKPLFTPSQGQNLLAYTGRRQRLYDAFQVSARFSDNLKTTFCADKCSLMRCGKLRRNRVECPCRRQLQIRQ